MAGLNFVLTFDADESFEAVEGLGDAANSKWRRAQLRPGNRRHAGRSPGPSS